MRKHEKKGREPLIKKEKSWNDHLLWQAALTSPVWKMFRKDRNSAYLLIAKYWFRFYLAIVNKCYCSVMRTKAGINQSGIIISLCACLYLSAFNANEIWIFFTGIGMVYIPVSMAWKDSDEMFEMLIFDTNSNILLCYNAILIITSLLDIIRIYTRRTDWKDISSRGTSRLYLAIKWLCKKLKGKSFEPDRPFIEGILEPVALFSIAVIMLQIDFWAATFIFMMALSETAIQMNNKAATLKRLKLVYAQNPGSKPRK
ncbi:hypothetical protein KORDIASMS9_01842 [Kordia sp. SMS9]|uniref:hypothetical protein n=1 Tax=Kordia sp. SMS9 TaxID=2282170 RepID=UPI000E0CF94D|nr:hypothetical protein [Kordia sp. SMS9]AXG69617.1 hypothetical protein KORDIASMS9_01842 [Kordia sp. SMS9]